MIVIELFAGVGGFRLGLEGYKKGNRYYSPISNYKTPLKNQNFFKTVFSNQFEPNKKNQIASNIYISRFGKIGHYNDLIENINADLILNELNKYNPQEIIMVGGFPCQDYSVNNLLKNSKGLQGKKGVLWWEIFRLLNELEELKKLPDILLFENVDRLLNSPSEFRGRDFATILYSLSTLGYDVEYQIINAADVGFNQSRSRLFFLAYKNQKYSNLLKKSFPSNSSIIKDTLKINTGNKKYDYVKLSLLLKKFSKKPSIFGNYGSMKSGVVISEKIDLKRTNWISFKSIKIDEESMDRMDLISLFVPDDDLNSWRRTKESKEKERIASNGFRYIWKEGSMELFHDVNKPLRTIVTSSGGTAAARHKHLIKFGDYQRVLHPLEFERANMFPDNFTHYDDITWNQRVFLMGNALVVGIVEKIRNEIISAHGNNG